MIYQSLITCYLLSQGAGSDTPLGRWPGELKLIHCLCASTVAWLVVCAAGNPLTAPAMEHRLPLAAAATAAAVAAAARPFIRVFYASFAWLSKW